MKAKDLSPDLILRNAKIYTLDARNTVAQAVAVKDGRILAVGSDAEVEALSGPATAAVDLGGQTVIPGIFDSHNHLMEVGAKLSQIRLDE
ncbi:MAG: amidohydrolase, partial [Anaerolineae bacterium]